MNIAFPAFFLLALILPGFIFTSAYERKENTSLDKKPFEASSASSLFWALCIQVPFAFSIHTFYKSIDFDICIKLLTGVKLAQSDIDSLQPDVGHIGMYFLVLYFSSWLCGKLAQAIVFKFNPYKSSLLSFDTPWYYELKGKLSSESSAQIIKVSCLLDTKESSYLYYGILDDFYLDSDGQLDRIVLFDVYRRNIKDDDDGSGCERYYQIKGERLILKYNQIINLNLEYLYIYEEPDN